MNKTLTIIVAILLSVLLVVSAFGAEKGTMKKGSWFMAGGWTAGFASAGGDLNKGGPDGKSVTTFNFSPSAGYFFADALGIGANISYASASQGDNKVTAMGIGPQAYYYIGASSKDIEKGMAVPYATVAFTYVSGKVSSANDEAKTKGYDIHIGLGGVYMLEKSLGVFAEAFYDMQSMKGKLGKDGEWSKSISGSELGIKIGVSGFFSFGK